MRSWCALLFQWFSLQLHQHLTRICRWFVYFNEWTIYYIHAFLYYCYIHATDSVPILHIEEDIKQHGNFDCWRHTFNSMKSLNLDTQHEHIYIFICLLVISVPFISLFSVDFTMGFWLHLLFFIPVKMKECIKCLISTFFYDFTTIWVFWY